MARTAPRPAPAITHELTPQRVTWPGGLAAVRDALPVPVAGVVSDGQHPIRWAARHALPGVPYQLCQFHYLREAARPVFEADRNAKKLLKKRVRQLRPIERAAEGRSDAAAEVVRGYCGAVRNALIVDGRPPLAASGLKLQDRLATISGSIGRAGAKGAPARVGPAQGIPRPGAGGGGGPAGAGPGDLRLGPSGIPPPRGQGCDRCQRPWVVGRAAGAMRRHRAAVGGLGGAVDHFLKVSRGYWAGQFACYDTADLPRTNNDLEQLFGSHRYHERRAAGRKGASPALVLRGSARLIAGLAPGSGR